jgi:hypothetical protein
VITVTLPGERVLNAIDVNPITFSRGRQHQYYLASLQVETQGTTGEVLSQSVRMDSGKRFIFAPVTTKKIQFYFVDKDQPYPTLLGHYFLEASIQTTTQSSSNWIIFSSSSSETHSAIQRVASAQSAYAINSQDGGSWFFGLPGIIGIGSSESTSTQVTDLQSGYDIFKGKRWGVGISDLSIIRFQYQQIGDIVSQEYTFATPVTALWIDSIDSHSSLVNDPPIPNRATLGDTSQSQSSSPIVPLVAPTTAVDIERNAGVVMPMNIPPAMAQLQYVSDRKLSEKTTIHYFLSVDGGTWQKILAHGTGVGDVLHLDKPATRVRVKIHLERSAETSDDTGYSPVIYSYELIGATLNAN